MGHKHPVYDTDTHFSINPVTRIIKNESSRKTKLVQGDHEGHDMSVCNVVEVHYLNIDSTTKDQNSGLYTVEDLQTSPEDEAKVICSWLISENATELVGPLNFLVRFRCVENDYTTYAWNTAVHSDVSISNGINAGEMFIL